MKVEQWIRESNLIEGVDDPAEDQRSARAWNWFKLQLDNPLTLEMILILHRKIMRIHFERRGWTAGQWRYVNVRVGSRICPDWQHLRGIGGLLEQWLATWGKPDGNIECQDAHIAFEKIHPFIDGNGRTGRMIMNWQMVKIGLTPILITKEQVHHYYKWFEEPLTSGRGR